MRVLLASMSGCILDMQACANFDLALRAALDQKSSGVQFIEREQLIAALKERGFLAIDANFPDALPAVASDTGAQILVAADVTWETTHYRLRSVVVDPASRVQIAKFDATIDASQPGPSGIPILLDDPETRASFILWNNDRHAGHLFKIPLCDVCPPPTISVEALAKHLGGTVVLLATITATGGVENLVVAKSPDPLLESNALATVQRWTFKPALDFIGQPFAARVVIDVKFPMGY